MGLEQKRRKLASMLKQKRVLLELAKEWGHEAVFDTKQESKGLYTCTLTFDGIPLKYFVVKCTSKQENTAPCVAAHEFWRNLYLHTLLPFKVMLSLRDITVKKFPYREDVVTFFRMLVEELLTAGDSRKLFLKSMLPRAQTFWESRGCTMKEAPQKGISSEKDTEKDFSDQPHESQHEDHARGDHIKEESIESINDINLNEILNYEQPLEVVCLQNTARIEQILLYREKHPDEFAVLDQQIKDHYLINTQSQEIFATKMDALTLIHRELNTKFPNFIVRLHAFGSTINGCGSFNSDMDVCLTLEQRINGESVFHNGKTFANKNLQTVYRHLTYKNHNLRRCIGKMEFVRFARVPIIKIQMTGEFDGLDIDLCLNNRDGIYNSWLIHYYSRVDERFPELCLLVKHWAIRNDIGNSMGGTFNSYSLLLLVLHYLQCAVSPPVLPNLQYLYPDKFTASLDIDLLKLHEPFDPPLPASPKNTATSGELLCGFFHYYADFKWNEEAISVRTGGRISRSSLEAASQKYFMYIEEPFNKTNTARCVNSRERVKRAFREASDAFSKFPPLLSRIKVVVN